MAQTTYPECMLLRLPALGLKDVEQRRAVISMKDRAVCNEKNLNLQIMAVIYLIKPIVVHLAHHHLFYLILAPIFLILAKISLVVLQHGRTSDSCGL